MGKKMACACRCLLIRVRGSSGLQLVNRYWSAGTELLRRKNGQLFRKGKSNACQREKNLRLSPHEAREQSQQQTSSNLQIRILFFCLTIRTPQKLCRCKKAEAVSHLTRKFSELAGLLVPLIFQRLHVLSDAAQDKFHRQLHLNLKRANHTS
jgi:hypothetical protein